MQRSSYLNRPFFFAYVLISLAAIFYLPYLVPMHPSASDSYLFGYNNHAGIALLLILVSIGALGTQGLHLQFESAGTSPAVSRTTLAWSLLAVLVGCIFMHQLAAPLGGTYETVYEVDRGWMLSIGKVPYADFEWPFGLAFLYGPLILHNLLRLELVRAYYLFWLINWLLGTVLLYAVVNMVDYPTRFKRTIFLLMFSGGFFSIIFMGTHYTFLRFTCPLFFILLVHKVLKRQDDRSRIYAALLATAFTIVLLFLSPETAIAHALACVCVFLLVTPRWSAAALAPFLALLLALAAVFSAALKLRILDTVRASGSGADSLPIALAPHILLFFAALFCCACYLYRRLVDRRFQDNTLCLLAFSLPMLAAALGRCDPFHVFWNGEGILLASMFYLSSYRLAWRGYRVAFVLVLVALPLRYTWPMVRGAARASITYSGDHPSLALRSWRHLHREYVSRFASPQQKARWQRAHTYTARLDPDRIDLAFLYPSSHANFLAPFGYKPNGTATYLSKQVDYGHFEAFENTNTVAEVRTKLSELEDQPDKALLLPNHFENLCATNVEADRRTIRQLFSFPYRANALHPESVHQPVCSYILAHSKMERAPNPQNFGYGLWIENSLQPRLTTLSSAAETPNALKHLPPPRRAR